MSIWGKVIGGVAGFAVGGPIGALLGAAAGHAVDRLRGPSAPAQSPEDLTAAKRVAFTVAVIVLGAKMAKADGRVTRAEVDAFKTVFRIPEADMKGVGRIFDEAKHDASGFEPYARQVADMFRHAPVVLEELLGGLFQIAKADGVVDAAELDFLREVARIFGFGPRDFERIRQSHQGADAADPYRVLGVARDADEAAIKAAYRALIRENHPDRLMAEGMPSEFVQLANDKMATINAAYDAIRKQRGFS